jgi:hypothetical protein
VFGVRWLLGCSLGLSWPHFFSFFSSHSPGLRGASKKKPKKKQGPKKQSQKTTDRLFFFSFFQVPLPSAVDMPPHVVTRSWLWGLPL